MRCVAGYMAHNDVSGSSLVKEDGGNFVRGKNLPASAPLERAKITRLTDKIVDSFGVRPTVYLAGRYGYGRNDSGGSTWHPSAGSDGHSDA